MEQLESRRASIEKGAAEGSAKMAAKMVENHAAKFPPAQYEVNDKVLTKDYSAVTKQGKILIGKSGQSILIQELA